MQKTIVWVHHYCFATKSGSNMHFCILLALNGIQDQVEQVPRVFRIDPKESYSARKPGIVFSQLRDSFLK